MIHFSTTSSGAVELAGVNDRNCQYTAAFSLVQSSMALHFVSTSILSSEDGIGFEKEIKKDTEDVRLAKQAAALAQSKPLYEQLADQQRIKDEEYEANTKLIFGTQFIVL
jgi:hypothetical protein